MSFTVHFYDAPPEGSAQAYAVIIALHEGKLLWCRHRDRDTWEIPGGHIEPGETALAAATASCRRKPPLNNTPSRRCAGIT